MKKIINLSRISILSVATSLALLFVLLASTPVAQAAITSQLELGSRGTQVSELQQFLATNSLIYPAGIVSGYYGPLTRAAVLQFQVAYDISQVGRVGPTTMAKMNSIMSSGLGLDVSSPMIANKSLQTSRNSATVNWMTGEPAQSQVYLDTQPLRSDEATMHAQQPYVSGTLSLGNVVANNSHSVVINGLQPNTVYYFITRAIDRSGNVSMTLQNSFVTNQ